MDVDHRLTDRRLTWLLRLEGGAIGLAAMIAYGSTNGGLWLFVALILVPDLSMVGYLRDPRVGAVAYNAAHTYLAPLALAALSWTAPALWPIALVWAAHIGFDRLLGLWFEARNGLSEHASRPPLKTWGLNRKRFASLIMRGGGIIWGDGCGCGCVPQRTKPRGSPMLSSFKVPAFTALLALGVVALPGSASALPGIPAPQTAVAASALPVENAQSVGFYYNRGYHGPRYRVVRPGYRHYHGGYYYRNPYWQPRYYAPRRYYRSGPSVSFGLSFGGNVAPRYRGGRTAHYAWCRDRYRTYDARTDSFIARAGGPRVRCRSPY